MTHRAEQEELETNYSAEELKQDRIKLQTIITARSAKLQEYMSSGSKFSELRRKNKLNNIELDEVAGYLDLLVNTIKGISESN